MNYFTELFARFAKAPKIRTAQPRASSEPAPTVRPEAVHVSPERPVAPEASPEDTPTLPAAVGE